MWQVCQRGDFLVSLSFVQDSHILQYVVLTSFYQQICLISLNQFYPAGGPKCLQVVQFRFEYMYKRKFEIYIVKGTVSRDLRPVFCLKDSIWAPYEQAKILGNTVRKSQVRVVNDYADMQFFFKCPHSLVRGVANYAISVPAQSTTTPTSCPCSQRLR